MEDATPRTKLSREACYGIPVEEIARRCKVDLTTARRWKRGVRRPPVTALMILAEDLGCFDRTAHPQGPITYLPAYCRLGAHARAQSVFAMVSSNSPVTVL
jgi:transcriptional regulator with XRE-family HTH domain